MKMELEKDLEKKMCHDCHVLPGELHTGGCDTERCPECGGQLIGCGCYGRVEELDGEVIRPPCGEWPEDSKRLPWTGIYPGVVECIEFGWYSKWDEDRCRWVRCEKDDPKAGADLNRLHPMTGGVLWDKELKRWVLPKSR